MTTVTGKLEDASGAPLHARIDFTSLSTPLAFSGGLVVANTDTFLRSDPSDGTFSVPLEAGNYTVTIAANGRTTSFTIVVPPGDATVTIDSIVATPLAFVFTPPNTVWNGVRMGHITFVPTADPAAPSISQVAFAGGHVNDGGAEKYSYWVSYITAAGETYASPMATFEDNLTATPNSANRITLTPNVSGVTAVRIWRTVNLTGHYYAGNFPGAPGDIGLLATVDPAATHYDDWESAAAFAARYDSTIVGPLFNSTAGELLSSNGTVCAFITDQGLYFPGTNCRVKPGLGLQVYNFDTNLWYTLLVKGLTGAEQLGLDAGNPN